MPFTTPCFVRIKDEKERKEVIQQLEELSYEVNVLPISTITYEGEFELPCNGIHVTRSGIAYLTNIDRMPPQYIDCGTNIPLFLALAALNNENDYRQWFTCMVRDCRGNRLPNIWVLCDEKTLQEFANKHNSPSSYDCFHKATVEELVEHFKKNKQ